MKKKLLITVMFSSLLFVTACTQQTQTKTSESSSRVEEGVDNKGFQEVLDDVSDGKKQRF
ncbi:major membrane immunogen (membrane-anchored lipoprotein) [Enterococcus rotai]|uniref:Uncharacterized protein n=1 Tax=Enterococcus rotai TaxID=118060 RepID=A0A0U2WX19_9ENTE|nr:hypothetical protein [Enterococcus rotai]ALS38201.1 hypothetical protein ATZ35_13905 [Enterococcus rotai]